MLRFLCCIGIFFVSIAPHISNGTRTRYEQVLETCKKSEHAKRVEILDSIGDFISDAPTFLPLAGTIVKFAAKQLDDTEEQQEKCEKAKFVYFEEQFGIIKDLIDEGTRTISLQQMKTETRTIFNNCFNTEKSLKAYREHPEHGTRERFMNDCVKYRPENALSDFYRITESTFEILMKAVRYSVSLYFAMGEEFLKDCAKCFLVAHYCFNYTLLANYSEDARIVQYENINREFMKSIENLYSVSIKLKHRFRHTAQDDIKKLLLSLDTEQAYQILNETRKYLDGQYTDRVWALLIYRDRHKNVPESEREHLEGDEQFLTAESSNHWRLIAHYSFTDEKNCSTHHNPFHGRKLLDQYVIKRKGLKATSLALKQQIFAAHSEFRHENFFMLSVPCHTSIHHNIETMRHHFGCPHQSHPKTRCVLCALVSWC